MNTQHNIGIDRYVDLFQQFELICFRLDIIKDLHQFYT